MDRHPTARSKLSATFVLVACAWMAVVAAVLQATVFRYGSVDLDDLDYRNQAGALRHGQITLSAATHSPYFVPYLTGVHQGRIVFTHQPLWPAFLAVFEFVRAPLAVAVAVQAALCAGFAILLVHEVFEDRRIVVVSTACFVLSPMVMIQSGTLLGYLPTLTLGLATTALALRAVRLPGRWLALGAGFAGGLLVFNRPYDAALFLVPLAVYGVAVRRRPGVGPVVVWGVVGAALPVVLMLSYNAAVMGSIWRFPYTVHPQDTFGFGSRASFGPSGFRFGPSQAWSGLVHNTGQALSWTVGGVVGIGLAVVGLVAQRRNGRMWILAAWIVVFPLAYFFFWTTWNIANFGLIEPLGPLYYLPSLAALAVLAGAGLVRVARGIPALAAVAVLAMVVLTVLTLRSSISENLTARTSKQAQQELVSTPRVTPRLVITQPAFPDDPYVRFQNPPDLVGPVLYAMSPGQTRTLQLLDSRPGVAAFAVTSVKAFNGVFRPAVDQLTEVSLEHGSHVDVTLTFRPPDDEVSFPVSAYAAVEGSAAAQVRIPAVGSDGRYTATWSMTPEGVSSGSAHLRLPVGRPVVVHLGFWEGGNGSVGHGGYEYRYAVRSEGAERLAVLVPGQSWRRYVFPGDKVAEAQEDLTGVLGAVVTGT